MRHIVEVLPKMKDVRRYLDGGQSVLLYAPKFHGKRRFLEAIRSAFHAGTTACVHVSSMTRNAAGRIDYQLLWVDTARQLGVAPSGQVTDIEDYKQEFRAKLDEMASRVIVLITGAGRGNEQNHLDLLSAFHHLLRDAQERLIVLAADDYSFYSYRETLPVKSDWSYYEELHCLPLQHEELRDCILEFAREGGRRLTKPVASELALRTLDASGGHAGLVQAIVADLAGRSWKLPDHYWGERGPDVLLRSPVLLALGEALKEDPHALCHTALEFRVAKYSKRSVRIDVLTQLGILQRLGISSWMLRLCPGAITRMVEEIGTQPHPEMDRKVGSVLSVQVPRMYLEGDLKIDDEAFVAVHLSDLHVSEHHAFQLPTTLSIQNEHARPVVDLLVEDLKSLELVKWDDSHVVETRVDALILSGDFVWNGKENQDFHRARDVVKDILKKIGLGPDRLVMVPGNHDLEWGAGQRAQVAHGDVSLENYKAFAELLRSRMPTQADLVTILSRSKTRKLRIVELDSNAVERIGYVASAALDRASELLKSDDAINKDESFEQVLTWVVVHHHVFPATSARQEDAGRKHVSVLANSDELMYYTNRWKADLILHGHEHQPSVSVACRWPVDRPDELAFPITVIGAGSIGVRSEFLSPIKKNQYYIIYRRPNDIVVRSRCLGDKGLRFGPHGDLFLSR
jgi:3',5'-cyclic AMP phosphodiesterase CpdA